jgi:hypothetical protein
VKARLLELGVGFQYWHNMFGKDADKVPGAKEFTPVFTLAVHPIRLSNSATPAAMRRWDSSGRCSRA